MILTETPRRKLVTNLVNWGHWFALLNILIAIIISSVYIFNSPAPGSMLGSIYLMTNWLSHIAFLTFFGFVIFILPLCYLVNNAKVVKTTSSVMAAIGLALLAFDALLYTKYGLHINFSSAALIKTETQTRIAAFGWQEFGFLALLFFVWLSFQLIIANALWQRLERFQKLKWGLPITSFFMLCFVTSHAVHVWADANLYQPIVQQDDMLPLSYPATGKTLMSKYGLLDIENYQQRKELQFKQRISGLQYPAHPVYCAVSEQNKVVLLVQTDDVVTDLSAYTNLKQYNTFYDLSSSTEAAELSILYGLPELYEGVFDAHTPVLLDLPSKLGLPVYLHSETDFFTGNIAPFNTLWNDFKQSLEQDQAKLAIGFLSGAQINALLTNEMLTSHKVIVSQLRNDRSSQAPGAMWSNVALAEVISSNEDLAPTLLNIMGCQSSPENYSTGRNLINPLRNWLISTQGSKVVLFANGQRIEVMSNGNYKIYDVASGDEVSEPLNTSLLSQAIKHLSQFAKY